MAETKEALLARYEELRDKEDATWQAWRILNRSRVEAFDAWLAAARGENAVQVEVVTGPLAATPCGTICSDAPLACATCTPAHPAEANVCPALCMDGIDGVGEACSFCHPASERAA
jgi:hypothetical protein